MIIDLLMQYADTAMYQAKLNGRSHFQCFSQSMRAATEGHVSIETHLCKALVAMAHSLNLEVVAEGVENRLQLEFLRQRGVKLVQGYLYSPPVLAGKFRSMLTSELQVVWEHPVQVG